MDPHASRSSRSIGSNAGARVAGFIRILGIAGLFSGFGPGATPRFPHIRTEINDYRIAYLPSPARAAEYAWTAQHYDRIVLDWGDAVSMPVYRRLSPSAEIYRYALSWTVIQPASPTAPNIAATYYPDMQAWYAAHRDYDLERALLHRPGCGPTPACRVSFKIWKDDRWAINPGDPGLRAYQRHRLARLAADADGLFLDEQGSGDFEPLFKARAAEYSDAASYQRDMISMLREIRSALGTNKGLLINTATYVTPWDAELARAAGGAHGEHFNDPVFPEMERRWTFAESVLASGASMHLTPPDGPPPREYSNGGYETPLERWQLWELASSYLIAPLRPGLLFFNANGSSGSQAFSAAWFKAIETNVGAPSGARRVLSQGNDRAGRPYRVWARDYGNALVLVRPVISWQSRSYGDDTAADVALPGSGYHLLHADGTRGPSVSTIALRAGEAAILMK
ncbi:MAG: hypothetical protein JWM41_309 [Gemmatimonadetes bacterium]|nr:hypothetical protein [Gemmatimonadota bacterium]